MFLKLIVLCTVVFGCSEGVINSKKAGPYQFKWQAGITAVHGDRTVFCGGALISLEWVLTAAHCIHGATSFSIRVGTTHSSGDYNPPLEVIPGARSIYHPRYDPETFNNDIGLIKLAHSASYDQNYKVPIKLPEVSDLFPAGTEVAVSGWGSTRDGGPLNLDLMYAKLKTITNDECKNYYNSKIIIHSTLCAKGATIESPCHGDDGGALVRDLAGVPPVSVPVHVGIVSMIPSIGCAHGWPSVYTRTVSYRDWIREHTGI